MIWKCSFQAKNFKGSQIADTIWCNDKSITNGDSGYGNYYTDYAAYDRLTIGQRSITLICSNDNQGGKLSKFTVSDTTYGNGALTYKIGMLTADEVAFAGNISTGNTLNITYYLTQNATRNVWWTMSPYRYGNSQAHVWIVNKTLSDNIVSGSLSMRTSLALKSKALITSGTGTATDPYKVTF